MKNAILIALASGLATVAALTAFPALAQETQSQANISLVRTADLDLASGRDRNRLDRRLVHAVREVCGTASETDVAGGNDVRRCIDETLADARAQRDRLLAAAGHGAVIAVSAAR